MNFKKYILIFIAYLLPTTIGLNFYLRYQNNNKVEEKILYEKLFEIGYYKEIFNPYQKTSILKVHPTNYFSLPLNKEDKKNINNKVLSLNNNGFRKNPYNSQDKSKKNCILFLGSSAGFGVGTSSNELTVPAILNKKLGDKYRVYNLSIPSWNSRQELISLVNFLSYKEFESCLRIDTISFSGTADLNDLESLKKSSMYKNLDLRKNLFSASGYFPQLEEKIDIAIKTKNQFRYNLRIIFNKLIKLLFGDLAKILNYRQLLTSKNNNEVSSKNQNQNQSEENFIYGQLKSFINNQKNINLITNNLGGNHLLVIQPNLKNANKFELDWANKNKILSKVLNQEKCLNILDARNHLIDKQAKYKYENKNIPFSLIDAIKLKKFNKKDFNNFYFFDKSHLTDLGNKEITKKIYDKYTETQNQKKCFFR